MSSWSCFPFLLFTDEVELVKDLVVSFADAVVGVVDVVVVGSMVNSGFAKASVAGAVRRGRRVIDV